MNSERGLIAMQNDNVDENELLDEELDDEELPDNSAYETMTEKEILIRICRNTDAIKGFMMFYLVLTVFAIIGYCVMLQGA